MIRYSEIMYTIRLKNTDFVPNFYIGGKEYLGNYKNCFWYVFLTISTIGYGDIVADSIIGKLYTNIAAFWGMIFISVFVVVLVDLFK